MKGTLKAGGSAIHSLIIIEGLFCGMIPLKLLSIKHGRPQRHQILGTRILPPRFCSDPNDLCSPTCFRAGVSWGAEGWVSVCLRSYFVKEKAMLQQIALLWAFL